METMLIVTIFTMFISGCFLLWLLLILFKKDPRELDIPPEMKPFGVRGLLWLFAVLLTISAASVPLAFIAEVGSNPFFEGSKDAAGNYDDNINSWITHHGFAFLFFAFWQWFLVYRLVTRFYPSTVRQTLIYLISAPIISVIFVLAVSERAFLVVDEVYVFTTGLVTFFFISFPLSLYLHHSRRVRNTYRYRFEEKSSRRVTGHHSASNAQTLEMGRGKDVRHLDRTMSEPYMHDHTYSEPPRTIEERLSELQNLYFKGLITQEEFEQKKRSILDEL